MRQESRKTFERRLQTLGFQPEQTFGYWFKDASPYLRQAARVYYGGTGIDFDAWFRLSFPWTIFRESLNDEELERIEELWAMENDEPFSVESSFGAEGSTRLSLRVDYPLSDAEFENLEQEVDAFFENKVVSFYERHRTIDDVYRARESREISIYGGIDSARALAAQGLCYYLIGERQEALNLLQLARNVRLDGVRSAYFVPELEILSLLIRRLRDEVAPNRSSNGNGEGAIVIDQSNRSAAPKIATKRASFLNRFFKRETSSAKIVGNLDRVFFNFRDYVKELRRKGVDLNKVEIGGRHLITWAIETGSTDALRLLLDKNADCNYVFRTFPEGPLSTPLSFARARREFYLRRSGQNPGASASVESCDKSIELLLARGAREPVAEDERTWARDLFERRRSPKFSGALKERGDEPGEQGELVFMGRTFKFRWIPNEDFSTGNSETGGRPDETSPRAKISRGFWALETLATQEMYLAVMGKNQGSYLDYGVFEVTEETKDYPAEGIALRDAKEFCAKLNELSEGRYNFRLPTGAEWERACRSEPSSESPSGKARNGTLRAPKGWKRRDKEKRRSCGRPYPVRSFPPNQWNLYDAIGNVRELVEERSDDPLGIGSDASRDGEQGFRGESFLSPYGSPRRTNRGGEDSDALAFDKGFRVVVSPVEDKRDFDAEET